MSSYSNYDFSETLKGQSIKRADVKSVIAAWGNVDKDGACCDECGGEWSGGFLLKLKAKGYAYASGYCDYTGWGCQDGTQMTTFDKKPKLAELEDIPLKSWDINPADLNALILKPEDEY